MANISMMTFIWVFCILCLVNVGLCAGTTVPTTSTKTPVTQSTGTIVHTTSTKTPVTQSTGTIVHTTSTKTPVTQSTGNDGSTTETKNPETTSHGTGVTSDHGKDNVTPTEKGLSEACQPGECQSPLRCYFGKCACGTNLYYANSRCHHMPAVVNVTTTLAYPSKDIRDTDITEDFLSSLDKELYDQLKRSIPGLKGVLLLGVSIENSTTGILHITTKNVINTTVSRNTQNNGENGTAHSGTQKPENYLVNLADGLKNLTKIQLKVQNYTFERPSVEVEGKCFDPNNITNEVLTRWGQQIRVQVYHNAITPISTISPDNSTATSTSTVSDGSSSAMDAATIGAAVGGGVAGLILIVVVAILVHQHYSKKRSNKVDVLPRNDETACEGNSESQVEYHMKDISQTA